MDDPKPGCSGIQKRKFDTICDLNYEENSDGQDMYEKKRLGNKEVLQNEEKKYKILISSSQWKSLINLPDDVIYIIGRHLDPFDLYSLSRTCLRFHHLVTERSLWKNIDFRDTTDISTNLLYHFNRFLSPSTIAYNTRGRSREQYPPSINSRLMTGNLLKEIKSKCPELKTLRIEDDILQANEIGMKDLPETLEVLSLSGSILWKKPYNVSYFFRIEECLPRLTTICLRNCPWFEPHSLMLLSKVRLLQHLDLSHCMGLSECMAYFSLSTRYGFLQLKTFDLRNTHLCDSEISCLNSLPKLTEVLLDCPVSTPMIPERLRILQDFNTPDVRREPLPNPPQAIFFIHGNREGIDNDRNNRINREIMRNPELIQGIDLEVDEPNVLNAQNENINRDINPVIVQRHADNIRIMNDNLGDYPEIFQPDVEEQEFRNENEQSRDSDDLESDNVFHPPYIVENMPLGMHSPHSPENYENIREEVYRDDNIIVERVAPSSEQQEEIDVNMDHPNLIDPSPNNQKHNEYDEAQANVVNILNKTESDNVKDQNFNAASCSKRDTDLQPDQSLSNNLEKIVKPNDKTTQTCSRDLPLRLKKCHYSSRDVKKIISNLKKRKIVDEMDQYLERRSKTKPLHHLVKQMPKKNVGCTNCHSPDGPMRTRSTVNSRINRSAEFVRHRSAGLNLLHENLALNEPGVIEDRRELLLRNYEEEDAQPYPMNIDAAHNVPYEPVIGVIGLPHFPRMERERNVLINLEFQYERSLSRFISDRAICSFGSSPASNALNLVRIQANYMPQQREPILERLTIRNYRLITDQSLRHLSHAAPKLRFLDVTGTNVTIEGVTRFMEERPECEILSDFTLE